VIFPLVLCRRGLQTVLRWDGPIVGWRNASAMKNPMYSGNKSRCAFIEFIAEQVSTLN